MLLKLSRCQFSHAMTNISLTRLNNELCFYCKTHTRALGFLTLFQQNVIDVYVKTAGGCCEFHSRWTATKCQRTSLFMTVLHVLMYVFAQAFSELQE